jgi:hypothetical protein
MPCTTLPAAHEQQPITVTDTTSPLSSLDHPESYSLFYLSFLPTALCLGLEAWRKLVRVAMGLYTHLQLAKEKSQPDRPGLP